MFAIPRESSGGYKRTPDPHALHATGISPLGFLLWRIPAAPSVTSKNSMELIDRVKKKKKMHAKAFATPL